jgi:Acetyltransferase (GNAT) domain
MFPEKIMSIRLAEYDELKKLSQLMLEIFDLKMKEKYTSEAEASFVKEIALSSLEKRYLQDSLFYISIEDEEIKGVLELERPCHIAFLFVKEERKGIAKSLCAHALSNCKEEVCTVGAFKDAIEFYQKLDFMILSQEDSTSKLPFTLMAKILS